MTIWKYPFGVTDEFSEKMPDGAEILSVQTQGNQPCMWAKVHEDAPFSYRRFRIFGTGQPIEESLPLRFVGTFQMNGGTLVFHLFELLAE